MSDADYKETAGLYKTRIRGLLTISIKSHMNNKITKHEPDPISISISTIHHTPILKSINQTQKVGFQTHKHVSTGGCLSFACAAALRALLEQLQDNCAFQLDALLLLPCVVFLECSMGLRVV